MADKLSVSIDSVLCRLEIKEVYAAAAKHVDCSDAMMQALKMNLDLQNGTNYREKTPMISLRDWGLIILHAGLCAIAASEEDDQEDQDASSN